MEPVRCRIVVSNLASIASMADRYFCETPIALGPVTLDGPEAHHLIHVMRAARGTRVVLFDGNGAEFPAVIEKTGRSEVQLNVIARDEINRELPFELTLAAALPKGDRQKWLVEKAVEIGVTRIVPLRTERGVAQPVEQALARLRRSVVEASKQCGRNRLMEITHPESWDDFLESTAKIPCRWLAHPKGHHSGIDLRCCMAEAADSAISSSAVLGSAVPSSTVLGNAVPSSAVPSDAASGDAKKATSSESSAEGDSERNRTNNGLTPPNKRSLETPTLPDRICLAIGPEGGFSTNEVTMAATAGWRTVDLGSRILRVETAAIVLAAMAAQAMQAAAK